MRVCGATRRPFIMLWSSVPVPGASIMGWVGSRSQSVCALLILVLGSDGPALAQSLEPLQIVTRSGVHDFKVEVAADDASRERGLMNPDRVTICKGSRLCASAPIPRPSGARRTTQTQPMMLAPGTATDDQSMMNGHRVAPQTLPPSASRLPRWERGGRVPSPSAGRWPHHSGRESLRRDAASDMLFGRKAHASFQGESERVKRAARRGSRRSGTAGTFQATAVPRRRSAP